MDAPSFKQPPANRRTLCGHSRVASSGTFPFSGARLRASAATGCWVATLHGHRSSGFNPVCLAMRVSIRGPISSPS